MRLAWLLMSAVLCAGGARAADTCAGMAISDAAADGNPADILKAGSQVLAVAQYRVMKHGGAPLYCIHGGSCYPASAFKLSHCKIGAKTIFSDDDADFYPVIGPK